MHLLLPCRGSRKVGKGQLECAFFQLPWRDILSHCFLLVWWRRIGASLSMNLKPSRVGVWVFMMACGFGLAPCPAALPELNVTPWFGHFLAFSNKKFTFGLTSLAEGKLTPLGRAGKPLNYQLLLPLAFFVEEVQPNGRVVTKKILPASLTTGDPATAKPGKVSFRGKVTGGASFEGHVEVDHGVVTVGGRILERGTLTKNPLRFGIQVSFPNAYRSVPQRDKREVKAFEALLKNDRVSLVWSDGKRVNLTGLGKIAPDSAAINGPGITELKVVLSAYQGKVFEFGATPNSRIDLWNRLEQAVHAGFVVKWYPDPARDPEGKARLRMEVQ